MKMASTWLRSFGFLGVGLLIATPSWSASTFTCQTTVENQLKNFVKSAAATHTSFVSRHEPQMQSALDNLIANIDCTYRLSHSMKEHERKHLLSMISGILDVVRKTKASKGEERDEHAQDAFRQMAHLSQFYNLNSNYQIFFCHSDKAFWLQEGKSPLNPIHPETFRNCGVRITANPAAVHGE
jgi:hypothetical protein